MKKIVTVLCFILCTTVFSGCQEISGQISAENILQQVETIAQQIDVEAIITEVINRTDWEEIQKYASQGYDALTEHFPALRSENIKSFLKTNGLQLLNQYVESSDETMQENARKLGEIIKILNPELSDEVNAVINN